MDTRELPHDLEAERALLGAMLIDKNACNDVINMATPQDFYLDAHRLIFTGMKFLHDGNKPIDATTVTDYLINQKILEKVGGVDYLLVLANSVPTVAHTTHYLQILNEKSLLRRLIKVATNIVQDAYGEITDINDFIDTVEKDVLEVTRDRNAGEFKTIESVVQNVTARMNLLQKNGGVVSGVKTGYKELDKLIIKTPFKHDCVVIPIETYERLKNLYEKVKN